MRDTKRFLATLIRWENLIHAGACKQMRDNSGGLWIGDDRCRYPVLVSSSLTLNTHMRVTLARTRHVALVSGPPGSIGLRTGNYNDALLTLLNT